jgi:hypothetical protein
MANYSEHETPASWARIQAQLPFYQGDEFENQPEDERVLATLGQDARDLGFENESFFVKAGKALAIPASFDAAKPVYYREYYNVAIEGNFQCYSKVMIGRIIGEKSVRAFCLAFDEAFILPHLDYLEEDRILHVPILAVNKMQKTS